MKREDIKALKEEVEADIKELGLTKSIATMVTRAARKYEGINKALEAFNVSVKKSGGLHIDKDIAWLVLLYGDLKEKSLAIFLGCWEGNDISKDEAFSMRDFLTEHLDEEGYKQHMDYFRCFRAMKNNIDHFLKMCYVYQTSAAQIARDIAVYDSITYPNPFFAELISMIPEGYEEKILEVMSRYTEGLRENTKFGHFVVPDKEKLSFEDVSADALLDDIRETAQFTNKALQYFKSAYIGYLEWAEEHGAKDFLPLEFRDQVNRLKVKDGIVTISPIWRKSVLDKKKANNEEVTEEEEKKGVLLSFSETEPIADAINYTKSKINYFYDQPNE